MDRALWVSLPFLMGVQSAKCVLLGGIQNPQLYTDVILVQLESFSLSLALPCALIVLDFIPQSQLGQQVCLTAPMIAFQEHSVQEIQPAPRAAVELSYLKLAVPAPAVLLEGMEQLLERLRYKNAEFALLAHTIQIPDHLQ
jgi:hypothetical protein